MKDLKISMIQTPLFWEDKTKNLALFTQKISEAILQQPDVIVLPEMFTTGFTMHSREFAEEMSGESVVWMQQQAKKHQIVLTGSIIIKENDGYYNRLLWVFPDGQMEYYDKRHLFRMANENDFFAAGKKRLIINYKGWRICPMVCYDLRFPVWSRNTDFQNSSKNTVYDCLIYVANWPEARVSHWEKLLEARAIENQCFVVGVNRIGKDGNGIPYSGSSAIIHPKGNKLSITKPHQENIETITLLRDELEAYRTKFPAWQDADDFILKEL